MGFSLGSSVIGSFSVVLSDRVLFRILNVRVLFGALINNVVFIVLSCWALLRIGSYLVSSVIGSCLIESLVFFFQNAEKQLLIKIGELLNQMQGCAQQDVKIRGLHTSEFLYFLDILGLRKFSRKNCPYSSNVVVCQTVVFLAVFMYFRCFLTQFFKLKLSCDKITFSKSEQTFTNTKLMALEYCIQYPKKACIPSQLDILIHSELLFSKFPDTSYTAILSLPFVFLFCLAFKLDLISLHYSFCSVSHQPEKHSPFVSILLTNNYMMYISRHKQ